MPWGPRKGKGGLLLVGACAGGFFTDCGHREAEPAPGATPSTLAAAPASSVRAVPAAVAARPYAKDYDFTTDWFTGNIPVWEQVLAPFKGKPGVSYLEIGLWEGRSALWVLENILTHPTARLTGIDVFTGEVKQRYLANLRLSGFANKATTIVGPSQQELRKLPLASFDIVYVDGSHAADDVLADAIQSWEVLKPGGILIFDDYRCSGYTTQLPLELLPMAAIDVFVMSHRHSLELVRRDYQMIVRKIVNPCAAQTVPGLAAYFCSTMGPYFYDWQARTLHRQDGSRVELTAAERTLLESHGRGWRFVLEDETPALDQKPELRALLDRLGIAQAGRR